MDYEKEISFGAFDSELMYQEIFIPKGFEATIVGNKIILKKSESKDEKIRKSILELVKQSSEILDKQNQNNMITWIEKQKAMDKDIIFRPLAGTDIIVAAKQALEKIEIGKEVVLAFNGAYIPVNGKTVAEICNEYFAWTEKQGEQKVPSVDFKAKDWYVSNVDGKIHNVNINFEKQGEQNPIMNVPTREIILAIWDLGNEWKELTSGDISTEYGTQLDYIQKHWHESEYYLREKQSEKKSKEEIKTTAYGTFGEYDVVEYVYILDYCSGRVIIAKHAIKESIIDLFKRLGLKENQCNYMVSSDILSIEYINF